MNNLKKSFLVYAALLWGTLDTWAIAIEEEADRDISTRKHVIDRTVVYRRGQFDFFVDGNTLAVEPTKPGKTPTQSVQIYDGQPQILPVVREEKLLMRIQPGRDGRIRIEETTKWPYLLNGQLNMQFSDEQYGGSGVLVGPHHILTAGHNVYSVYNRRWADAISVRLGLNKRAAPFGEIKAAKVYTFSSWVNEGNPNDDMALIVLDRSVGYETGWCGLLCTDDETLLREELTLTGYPGDKGFNKMMTMSHRVKTVEPEKLYYDIDTYGGQSGSGIRIDKWRSPYVVGIHTHGEGLLYAGNSGVRLSRHKFNKIIEWISESLTLQSPLPRSLPVRDEVPRITPLPTCSSSSSSSSSAPPDQVTIPDVARGFEDIYERFLRGVLVYRPLKGSERGKIELPIAALANPLGSAFDLSSCGDTGKCLSIAIGYRKGYTPANASKVEIWVTPRFLLDAELPRLSPNHHMREISKGWDAARAPIGIFWTLGRWGVEHAAYADFNFCASVEELGLKNLLEKHREAASAPREHDGGYVRAYARDDNRRGAAWPIAHPWRRWLATSSHYIFEFR